MACIIGQIAFLYQPVFIPPAPTNMPHVNEHYSHRAHTLYLLTPVRYHSHLQSNPAVLDRMHLPYQEKIPQCRASRVQQSSPLNLFSTFPWPASPSSHMQTRTHAHKVPCCISLFR